MSLSDLLGPTATSQGLDSTMVLPTIVTTMILPSPSFIPPDAGSHANPPPKFGAKNNTNDPISTNNSTASPALKVSKPIARSMSEVSASGEDADKQRCIFDSKSPRGCYQKNAEHLAKYSHPLGYEWLVLRIFSHELAPIESIARQLFQRTTPKLLYSRKRS